MRTRLFTLLTVIILIVVCTPTAQPQVATTSTTDCDTVNQVCNDMAAMMYNACIVSGCPPTDCAADEAAYRISCKVSNGCPLPKTNDY